MKAKPTPGYTYAFDDSGGIEPYLNKKKEFVDGDFPFLLVTSVGIRNDLLDAFRADWQALRGQMAEVLGLDYLPAFHARLMFGKTRPPTYRKKPNPYFDVPQEQTETWYLQALDLLSKYRVDQKAMSGLVSIYKRSDYLQRYTNSATDPVSVRESSYIRNHTYGTKKSKFHDRYIASSASALIEPVLDLFALIQEEMRQLDAQATVLLDAFSDSHGLDDLVVFEFIRERLSLDSILAADRVPDTDTEPLLQAADLVAYAYFRGELSKSRREKGVEVMPEPMLDEVALRKWPPRPCFANVGHIWRRKRDAFQMRRIIVAAKYAPAYYELSEYHPAFTQAHLVTPDEFLARISQLNAAIAYVPILKDGLLDAWEADRAEAEKAKTAQSAAP